jgi:vancomycin aglycone glucosyltransferase
MRVLLSTYTGRGDVEPLVGLAVRLRELGAEVRVCAPPDWAQRLGRVAAKLLLDAASPERPPIARTHAMVAGDLRSEPMT